MTYADLDTVLSIEDCFDIIEMGEVNAHNARLVQAAVAAASTRS